MLNMRDFATRTYCQTGDGTLLNLETLLVGRNVEDVSGELAQRMTLALRNVKVEQARGEYTSELVGLGAHIYHLRSADAGASWKPLFEGEVTDWDYDPDADVLTVTANDPLFAFAGHEGQVRFPEGQIGEDVLRSLFEAYGFPIGQIDGPSAIMPKIVHDGTMGDLLMQVLQHGLYSGDKAYLPRWMPGTPTQTGRVAVVTPGHNDPIYSFDQRSNLLGARERMSSGDMVREVWLVGNEAADTDSGRPPIEQRVQVGAGDARPKVGRRVLIKSADYDTPEAAKSAAQTLLERHREPDRDRTATVVDVPGERKGNVVKLRGGTLDGFYTILSVSHDEDARQMALTLGDRGSALYQAQKFPDPPAAPGTFGALSFGFGGDCVTQKMLAYAKQFLGTPYHLGGGGKVPGQPQDCSNFSSNVFRSIGIEIGGTTFSQIPNTQQIPVGQQRAGDLVFYVCGGNGDEQHVGIMLDSQTMINQTPPSARIQPYTAHSCFHSFRRVSGLAELNAAQCAEQSLDPGGSGAGAGQAGRVAAFGFSNVPSDLLAAVKAEFPSGVWAQAIALSNCETGGWTAFTNYNGEASIGHFQVNMRAHGGTEAYWLVTQNNVRKAAELWRASGGSFRQHWVNCSRRLGL